VEADISKSVLVFLRHCYKFLNQDWQHANRELIPDQGFEERLRESCILASKEWRVSQPREMNLGGELDTSSGVLHEIDLVVEQTDCFAFLEAKNRKEFLPTKNDVIVFFAKILDYLTCNPTIAQREICPVFISTFDFEQSGLAACLGLGIHPIAPRLRPLPILIETMLRMEIELEKGLDIDAEWLGEFTDFRSQVNRSASILQPTWFSERFGYQTKETITSKAVRGLDTKSLCQEFRQMNGQCSNLLNTFRDAKAKRPA
jgi:hypothetical protein